MTKEHWMYVALALVAVGIYLYSDGRSILAELKKEGVKVTDASLQKRIDAA